MLTSSSPETLHGTGGGRGNRSVVAWRYASAADVERFYNGAVRPTLRAVIVTLDGEPVGIIGVSREDGIGKYFSEYRDALKPHLRSITVMRAIKASMEFVKDHPGPVYAGAEHEQGKHILTRLGFTNIDGDLFSWAI